MHTTRSALRKAVLTAACTAMAAVTSAAHAQSPSFQTPYVTRAEAVMLLLQARIPKMPALTSHGEFPDVRGGAWYERYIVVGERLGIIQAHAVTRRIRPEDPVTRAEFVSMAAKTFGVNITLFSSSYVDVPPEAWYALSAGVAEHLGLFPGDPDPTIFHPEEFMIHGEVAKAVEILTDAGADTGSWKRVTITPQQPFQRISTATQNVALIKPRGAAPRLVTGTKMLPAATTSAQTVKLRLQVLALVNAERGRSGLPALRMHSVLEASAQRYARAMAEQDFFGHVSPTGETLKNRMEASGYYRPFFQSDCLCVARFVLGENLARGQKTAKEVVADWLASPSHRAAMMNPDFTDTGIGIVAGVWVQHFGGKQK